MSSGKNVIARFAIQGTAHLGSAVCGFATTLVMVRALGVDGFGAAALGLSVLSYAIVFSNFGAELHATQVTAHDPAALGRNLTIVMAVRAALAIPVLLVILGLCLSQIWEPGASLAVALFSLSVIVNIGYPLWAAQALERAPAIAACTFGGQLLNLVFVLVAAFLHAGVLAYAIAKIGSDLIVAVGLSAWFRIRLKTRWQPVAWSQIRQFFRDSAPLGVSQVLRSLALGSDLLMLSFFVSQTMVGLYAVPFRIFGLILSLSSVYSVVVLPEFVRSARDGSTLGATLTRLVKIPFLLFVLALGVAGLIAQPMLAVLFGVAFEPGSPMLQILFVAAAANFASRGYRLVIVANCRRVDDMKSTLVATTVSLLTKLAFILKFGIIGAAIGTTVGEVTLLILQRRMANRTMKSIDGG